MLQVKEVTPKARSELMLRGKVEGSRSDDTPASPGSPPANGGFDKEKK